MKDLLLTLDWEYVWKTWVITFLVLEGLSIWIGGENTLSHHVWRQFNVADGWSFEKVFVLLFTVWLGLHFTWQKF